MAKKSKYRGLPADLVIPPVDPELFGTAIQVGSAASAFMMTMKSPTTQGFNIRDKNARVSRLHFTDCPENRMAMAIRDHVAPDPEAFKAIMMRIFALQHIWSDERIEEWVKPVQGGEIDVKGAVVHAAATEPLNRRGYFDRAKFFAKVKESDEAERAKEAE